MNMEGCVRRLELSKPPFRSYRSCGFTLIEMSIVLVIIGLIVGGVLVGQDLIRAAGIRATIAQIEKYNQAVNTFREKYGALPGDLNAQTANQFGFAARGQHAGEGDGNEVLEGIHADANGMNDGTFQGAGETAMFWVDLSTANLIEGGFNTATSNIMPPATITGAALNNYLPPAKLGGSNYVYVWSGGYHNALNGLNYYGVSAVTSITTAGYIYSSLGLTVRQAYSIDQKVDDGLPQSGNVIAFFLDADVAYNVEYAGPIDTRGTDGSATTCYDNSGVVSAIQQYSLGRNGGAGVNCALSFQFQ
jgi:prepilin-type N-terminal cleavage/methylation domain-containing protein